MLLLITNNSIFSFSLWMFQLLRYTIPQLDECRTILCKWRLSSRLYPQPTRIRFCQVNLEEHAQWTSCHGKKRISQMISFIRRRNGHIRKCGFPVMLDQIIYYRNERIIKTLTLIYIRMYMWCRAWDLTYTCVLNNKKAPPIQVYAQDQCRLACM